MIDDTIKIKANEKKSITDSYNRVMETKNYLEFKKEISIELKDIMNNWKGTDKELSIALETIDYGRKKEKLSDEDKVSYAVSNIIASGILILK